jgi:hypothetical protein
MTRHGNGFSDLFRILACASATACKSRRAGATATSEKTEIEGGEEEVRNTPRFFLFFTFTALWFSPNVFTYT